MRITIERLRTLLLIGGGLLVAAIAVFLAAGQWKLRKSFRDIPGRLGIDVVQTANGVDYTQTRKGKTIFKIHAAKAITRKTGGTTALHDVTIDLYGDDGNRADTITGSEFEYDPNSGVATAAGAVEIRMMRPGVKPAISELKPAEKADARQDAGNSAHAARNAPLNPNLSAVVDAITDDEIHVKTSGLVFNQKTGVATTSHRVDFALRQGRGNSIGATYDSGNGQLILDRAVVLEVERGRSHANVAQADGPITVHAGHAEFEHGSMVCRMTQAMADYPGGTVATGQALIHFRDDGSVIRVDGSDGVDLQTQSGSHATAPEGAVEFDAANHPRHGILRGGARLQMTEPNRQMQGSSPTALLTFDAFGRLSLAHMEQGVVFNSQQQATTAKGAEAQLRRTWNSRTADVAFAPVGGAGDRTPDGKAGTGHVEPRTIHGVGGVVVTSQTITEGAAMPSRLAADTVDAVLAPGGALSSLHGTGHASFDERTASGAHRSTASDDLDVRFAPATGAAGKKESAASANRGTAGRANGSEIASVVELGHVAMTQDPAPAQPAEPGGGRPGSPGAPSGIRATASRADYDGATEILHLSGAPRVRDGALELTADTVDFARATGDAFAHGDVRASWTDSGTGRSSAPGGSLLAGSPASGGNNGPIHAIAGEAELHQASQEVVLRGAVRGEQPRLWQSVNSVSAPVITLNRQKQTLMAEAAGATNPVRTVLVSNGGLEPGGAGASGKPTGPGKAKFAGGSAIRVRSGNLRYSEAERLAIFRAGPVGQVTAQTTDASGTSTIVSQEAEVTLFPAGTHAAAAGPSGGKASAPANASIERLIAQGQVTIDWPGRHGSGEKLVYRSEEDTYTLTGTAASPPRISDEAQGTVTGSALILHGGDDRVTVEGDGGKTVTETRAKK